MLYSVLFLCVSMVMSTSGHLPIHWSREVELASTPLYNYETKYFTQRLDHFNANDYRVFQQRYLINTDHWKLGGPIFLYTGNEGDITLFSRNTGFMWEIAPEYGAMIVYAEHRYYGKSLPFGRDSFKDLAHLKYLTSEQALADYALLITVLKHLEYKTDSPVIAFGGSYGGMLAAWFRMKYPHIVQGALAASAPIWFFTGLTPCDSAHRIITQDFHKANSKCSTNIRASWSAIDQVSQQAQGTSWLSRTFRLCQSPLKNVKSLKHWLKSTWFYLAMVDYPYPANFLKPLPAWPVDKACNHLSTKFSSNKELLRAVASAMLVFHNSTGSTKCINLNGESTTSLGMYAWAFQACTEMVIPMCTTGVNDMFYCHPNQSSELQWDLEAYSRACKEEFGVTPDPYRIEKMYGGKNISSHSNIIFSNGLLDPWSGGGVLHSLSDSLVALLIPNGAHHLDLRASNPADPLDVVVVRTQEKKYLKKWIRQYYEYLTQWDMIHYS